MHKRPHGKGFRMTARFGGHRRRGGYFPDFAGFL